MASWPTGVTDGTRARVLELLRRERRSINELAAALGITDNAVRAHVARLQRDGMVRVTGSEPTGGKPAQLYEITPEAEELFPKAYVAVLTELLRVVAERDGREAVEAMLREVGRRAAPARPSTGGLEERVSRAAGVLRELGGEVDVEREGEEWLVRGYGCPLSGVVREHPDVCHLAEALVEEITGAPTRERCDRGERPRCAFMVDGGAGTI